MATVAAAACGKGGDKTKVEPADLQMVSAGNEPRTVLRYRIPKGTSQGIDVAVDMNVNANDMGGPLPTITMQMLIAVEDVDASGQMKLHTTIVDATARDRDDAKISATSLAGPLEKLKGLAFASTLSPNGRSSKSVIEGAKQLPDDVAAQLTALTSTLEQVMMPLPNEPVGVGAVWRSSRDMEQNGLKMTTVNTFSLVALDGDKLKYTIDTDVHGADQTVKMGDTSIDVKDITGTGGGDGSFSLTSLEMTAVLSAEFRSQMAMPGEATPTRMKMISQTKLAPQGAPMPSGPPIAPVTNRGSGSPPAGSASGSGADSASGSGVGSASGSAPGSATGSAGSASGSAGGSATGSAH